MLSNLPERELRFKLLAMINLLMFLTVHLFLVLIENNIPMLPFTLEH